MERDTLLRFVTDRLTRSPVDGWEIFLSSGKSWSVEVRGGEVDALRVSEPIGIGLRILSNKSIGFSFSTSFDQHAVDRTVESAMTAARSQTPDSAASFPLPATIPAAPPIADSRFSSLTDAERIDTARRLEALCRSLDRRVSTVRRAVYAENVLDVHIINSNGLQTGWVATSVSCSVSLVASDGSDSQSGWDFETSHFFDRIDPERVARRAVDRATGLLGARKFPTMKGMVLFDPNTAADMLELVARSFCGDTLAKGKSLLAGRRGERIFAPLLTVIDDGLYPDGSGTAPCDGEGVPSHRTVLVERGVVNGFLFDTFWGDKLGERSTGNGVRGGFRTVPRPAPRNLYIVPGSTSRETLIRSVNRGVLVTDLIGMHTADPVSGDLSVGVSGCLVERGELTTPVREMVLTGNVMELFGRVTAVGDDLRMFGPIGSPTLLVDGMDLSGR